MRKPKFKIGDKVRSRKNKDVIYKIININPIPTPNGYLYDVKSIYRIDGKRWPCGDDYLGYEEGLFILADNALQRLKKRLQSNKKSI